MPLFNIPSRSDDRQSDKSLISKSKSKKPAKTTVRSGDSMTTRIDDIRAAVETSLGKYRDETLIIQDEASLHDYIGKCVSNGICAIDTETTGLDPFVDKVVGVGIYTPGDMTAYIPIGHVSFITGSLVANQLRPDFVGSELARLSGVDIDMFNAQFDIRMVMHSFGVRLRCSWDSSLGARCLNENEPSNALKKLHRKYVLKGKEDAFKFDELFHGINFSYVPIDVGALYAAHDPKITHEYCEYQRKFLRLDHERADMRDVAWVFLNIEMPCIDAVIDLEESGIAFDKEYNDELKSKYHALLDEKADNFHKLCEMYADDIAAYKGPVNLDNPINIQSVPQLQALLYDIAKITPANDRKTKKPSRSTSEDVLKKLNHPLSDAILEYRSFSTIVSTFIDKLPECVSKHDGRVHCSFHQYGADTGRFSSSDPNVNWAAA